MSSVQKCSRTFIYFVAIVTLSLLTIGSKASAARVILTAPVVEDASSPEDVDDWEEQIIIALHELGHIALADAADAEGEAPRNANELRAIAEFRNARYAVVPFFRSAKEHSVELQLRVGDSAGTRMEQFRHRIDSEHAQAQIQLIIATLFSVDGVGDGDQLRAALAQISSPGEVVEEQPKDEVSEDKPAEKEVAEEKEAHRPVAKLEESKTEPLHNGWGASAMILARPLLRSRNGGAVGILQARAIYRFDDFLEGLDVRAGVDIGFGATGGFGLLAGSKFMFVSFDDFPLEIGAELELGMFVSLTGNRVASFALSASPVARYRLFERFHIEAKLLEFNVWSANDGVLTLGFGAGAAYHF